VSLTGVLVRLKVRLLVNRIRSAPFGVVGLMLAGLAGLAAGIAGFAALAAIGLGAEAADQRRVLVLGANALVLAWALLPLATVGADETLDPSRLVMFPLRRGPLMRGQIAASLVGIAPLAAVLALAGVLVGFGGGGAVVVAVPAVVLAVLLAVVVSRTLTTAFAAALTTRRARDGAVVVASLLFVSVQALRFIHLDFTPAQWEGLTRVLRWTPPGMLGQSVADAGRGRWLLAGAGLVPAALLLPALVGLWGRLLERSLTVVSAGAGSARIGVRPRAASDRPALFPRWAPWLSMSATGAVAARELRYAWREPRRKAALLTRTLLAIGGPVWVLFQADRPTPAVVLTSAAVGYLAVFGSFNQFGFDGAALASDVVAGNRVADLVRGKNLALVIQSIPPVVACAVLLAALSGGWAFIPAALMLTVASTGAGLAVADVISVRMPTKVSTSGNAFGGALFGGSGGGGGQGCVAGVVVAVAVGVQALVSAPPALAMAIAGAHSAPAAALVGPFAVVYGYGIWRLGMRLTVAWAWWREPEILAAVDATRSG